ncbi:MAG: 5-formyltetrahydrofolate cyclo-ligase [Verrucomicrobia bacterium]|nr:5-formyltetrahydrofolate cyclo-ligase [Verrucomicrobiota bacterium]
MQTKALLRLEAMQILSKLDAKRREEAALEAFLFLTTHLKDTSITLLSFASKPLEINLWPFNHWLLKNHRLLLPKIEKDSLVPYEITSLEQLVPSKHALKEPDPAITTQVPLEEIDLVLVPGLYFDDHSHRLGYGKGYFDRFLSSLPQAQKWGIGFTEQKALKIPHENHDIKLDKIFLF